LQVGCLGDQDLHPHVIADRHLVEQPAELGLHDREPLDQPIPPGDQLGISRGRRRGTWLTTLAPEAS
jgi:hypothetical protein